MQKKIFIQLVTLVCCLITGQGLLWAVDCGQYNLLPPFLTQNTEPSTTIILDNSGSMYEHAYQDREVWWRYTGSSDDRPCSTGFNATREYYGYFDPYAYYSYNTSSGYFYVDNSTGEWSGNFLNWVAMHRVDVVRKVLTGGRYTTSGSDYFLEVEHTDGSNHRGKYHVYNDTTPVLDLNNNTRHMTPYHYALGFGQFAGYYDVWIMPCTAVDNLGQGASNGERWYVSYQDPPTYGIFNLKLKIGEAPVGVLDNVGNQMRMALFVYDNDGSADNGGEVRKYMGSTAAEIKASVNSIMPETWTPLAETFYTVCGYIEQVTTNSNGPHYESDSYDVDDGSRTHPDPFYFADQGDLVACTQQNVILITDGESTKDRNIPSSLRDYDGDGNDPGSYGSDGSDYLDDVALWAHTTDLRSDLAGNQTVDLYTVFAFGSGSQLLKDAAKNGGFIDRNGNGQPDEQSEWDSDGDGVPDNYFEAASGSELESAILESFGLILQRVSSGSAASVVAGSRSGEGALYQAVFWPSRYDASGNELTWVGDVHALFVDEQGYLHEDTNQNQQYDSSDQKATLYYNDSLGRTVACVGGEVVNGTCNATAKELDEVHYLWSAANWLSQSSLGVSSNRSSYISNSDDRFIFTWFDIDNDGVVDDTAIDSSGEVREFTASALNGTNATLFCNGSVINWVRGQDQGGMRSRFFIQNGNPVCWRLGDVIHSTPVVVGVPAERYDLYWGDSSYSAFYKKYRKRRLVVYFGGNDGMVHAVNAGFYNPEDKKFYKSYSSGAYGSSGPDLGAELWAYVPYNLLPHLACLTDPNYEHKYYVDLHPRIFDVRIWESEYSDSNSTHPYGWGTIMVCGMRFGGGHVNESGRDFSSSYMIFDVTDPQEPPSLLGEFTYDYSNSTSLQLGYSLSVPSVVPKVDLSSGTSKWYLVLGTGPDADNIALTDAASTQKAKAVIVPLNELVKGNFSLRISTKNNALSKTTAGTVEIPVQNSYIGSDLVAVDYDLDLQTDIFYFGLVSGSSGNWGGGVWRLKVEEKGSAQDWSDPSKWELHELIDTDRPVTAAPNVGFKDDDVWVYFGTGRFLTYEDKQDNSTQYFFGVKEPKFTSSNAFNFSSVTINYTNPNKQDWILAHQIEVYENGSLACTGGGTSCLPTVSGNTVDTFSDLEDFAVEEVNNGWFRELGSRERVVGQPTLFGGLVNFSVYVPSTDPCAGEGTSYLYSVYYLTGTAWTENVFGEENSNGTVEFKKEIGQGLSITPTMHVGSEEGGKLFLQTSTGEIKEIEQPNLAVPGFRSGKSSWHVIDND